MVWDVHRPAPVHGQQTQACRYLECRVGAAVLWGVGIDASITNASLKAMVSAVNLALRVAGADAA